MGKKTKVGKSRQDVHYRRAKELGLRARSAFKLLEINRKFQFLERSRVCLDLCGAPGSWSQVAVEKMPVQSLVVCIDLVRIAPLHNVIALQEDITTDKCRQSIKKELQTWKADVVLHDGAPNVGKNWNFDAFTQCNLTLAALKLASEFLQKGGVFVTKVFRSKDYEKLMWVFRQLFRKATATKPKASRNESAEIFVVCEKFLAPDRVDPRFFDMKFVFKDVEDEAMPTINVLHPEKLNKKAEGYAENNCMQTSKLSASQFITADNHLALLASATQIVIDDDRVLRHKHTTTEVRTCCDDIKLLGKGDIRLLEKWRKKMIKFLDSVKEKETKTDEVEEAKMEEDEAGSDEEEKEVDKQLQEMHESQKKDLKKKRKKVMKEKRKLRDKMGLKMIIPGDQIQQTEDMELFDLTKIKTNKDLSSAQSDRMASDSSDDSNVDSDSDAPVSGGKSRKVTTSYSRYDDPDSDDDIENSLDGEEEKEKEVDEDDEEEKLAPFDEEEKNPLVVDLQSKDARVSSKTKLWFDKEVFTGMEERDVEDDESELEWETDEEEKEDEKGEELQDVTNDKLASTKDMTASLIPTASSDNDDDNSDDESADDSDDDANDDDLDVELKTPGTKRKASMSGAGPAKNDAARDGFEIVSAEPPKKVIKLTPVELAIGEQLIKSNKSRRELIELSFNRYTHGEENLPQWFAQDEARHSHKQLPVTKEQIQMYKEKQRAIDTNPIKKVAEAAARKKKRMVRRLEKARKKAEVVTDALDVSDKEKMKQVKEIYKKAGLLKAQKKEVTYVVGKKGIGKRVSRPPGVKGQFKVVDPRMKKDNKARKVALKRAKGKGKKKPSKPGKHSTKKGHGKK